MAVRSSDSIIHKQTKNLKKFANKLNKKKSEMQYNDENEIMDSTIDLLPNF